MAKNSAPDPRFDPRFQRGYDGPQPAPPATPALPSPIEPAPDPVAARATEHDHEQVDEVEPQAGADDNVFWSPPRRNPFAIALLVASLAVIAVGLWLIWGVVSAPSFPDGNDPAAQAFALIQQQLSPALLIAGVLGLVGWLVLGALAASDRKQE